MFRNICMLILICFTFVRADPPETQLMGLHQLIKKEYPQASIIFGFAALSTNVLEYIRLFGNYGPFDGVHPVIPRRDEDGSLRLKDSPQDWVTSFLQYLFPSSGLVGLVASTRDSDFTNSRMDIATVGRVIQVFCKVPRDDKTKLAGAILAALDPTQFLPKYNKQTKNAKTKEQKEKIRDNIWNSLGQTVIKVSKTTKKQKIAPMHSDRSNEKAAVIAYLVTQALLEQEEEGAIYPPHIVETALTAWAWKKSSNKKDLLLYFEAMPELLADNVQLGADNKITGFTDATGNTVSIDDWQKQEYTKQQYIDFKEQFKTNGATAELVKQLIDSPELSAFIGSGYYVYDMTLPPKRTYGSAKHPSLENKKTKTFPDCGSTSLRSFFEIILFNNSTRRFDVNILNKIVKKYNKRKAKEEKIDITFIGESEEDFKLPEFSGEWPGLKQLRWFFMKYPKPTKVEAAADDWALVTSDFAGVDYLKGEDGKAPVCEINAGIANMMKVVAKLIPDSSLISTETDVNDANAEILTNLCEIFSTDEKELTWQSPDGDEELESDTDVELTFLVNEEETFTWEFLPGHFELNPIVKQDSRFQTSLQDNLVEAYYQGMPVYLFNFYADPANLTTLTGKYDELMWPLVYSDLYYEEGKKRAITYMFENQERENYRLAWHWMNQMPTDDQRIQLFILDRLLMDQEWLSSLSDDSELKQKSKEYLDALKKSEVKTIIENNYASLLNAMANKKRLALDAKTIDDNELLILAAANGSTEAAEVLLDRGANIAIKNDRNAIPLLEAGYKGHTETVRLLLDRGAHIETTRNGETVLIRASSEGRTETVRLLLDRGANIEANGVGEIALVEASSRGHTETVRLLLDRGVNVEAKSKYGDRALMKAVGLYNKNTETIRLLLDRGANVAAKDKYDRTALMRAVKYNTSIVKLLMENGADIRTKNDRGVTAFDLAYQSLPKDDDTEDEEEDNEDEDYDAEAIYYYLKNIKDNFKYPHTKGNQDQNAIEYLKYLVNLQEKNNLPPRLLTYWSNQTLSGRQHGLSDTEPNKVELEIILRNIALSAKSIDYHDKDAWLKHTLHKNNSDKLSAMQQEHTKIVYTFLRYAQMRLAKMTPAQIKTELKKDDQTYNFLELEGYPNITELFDGIIDSVAD